MYRARRFRWISLLPTVAVGIVIFVSLSSSSRTATTTAATPAPQLESSLADCALIQEPGYTGYQDVPTNYGLLQPFGTEASLRACSLTVIPNVYAVGHLDLRLWNPTALAPDPTTVALRSLGYAISASESWESKLGVYFGGTVVTQVVPGVADPPRFSTAEIELHVDSGDLGVAWDPNSASSSPEAGSIVPGGAYQPLPGSHPVLSHFVCGGDAGAQDLRLIQCVMTTSALTPAPNLTLAQKFRVPRPAALQTIEVAAAPVSVNYYGVWGSIFVFDAEGQTEPPVVYGQSLWSANFYAPQDGSPAWVDPFSVNYTPTLVPDHDYWLIVDTGHLFRVYMRGLTGAESPYFTSNIGPMFSRADGGGAFSLIPNRALSFRMIGTTVAPVSVGPPAPSPASLRLAVAPNPARGNVNVMWSSAIGAVRFEVLDERGRRVSLGDWQNASEGRWTWRASNDRGQPAPAGVYFVRAIDGLGPRAITRVVLLR